MHPMGCDQVGIQQAQLIQIVGWPLAVGLHYFRNFH